MKLRLLAVWCCLAAMALALVPDRACAQDLDKAVQKAAAEVAAVAKKIAEVKGTVARAEQDLTEKTAAAQKAADRATQTKAKADKAVGEDKEKALKAAAVASKESEKAAVARAGSEKALAKHKELLRAVLAREKTAAAALENAQYEKSLKNVADARALVLAAEVEKDKVLKSLQPKVTTAKTLAAAAAASRAKADQAAEAAGAAKALLDKAPDAKKAALEKAYREKAALAKVAADKAKAARASADKVAGELKIAEQALAQKDDSLRASLGRLAAAKAEAYGGLKPLADRDWDFSKARHLLARAGFGGPPEEVAKLQAMGLHRAVGQLVDFKNIQPPDIPITVQLPEKPEPYEKRLAPKEQNIISQRRQRIESLQMQAVKNWWMRRMAETPRPLEEKLTLFWHGLFSCQYTVVFRSHFMFAQNQLFRENAAGNYGALLNGIVHDATMLRYLNNDTNVKGRPNENLAREIMELFAMGLDQGYTEFDIREAARALTGYTYDPWSGQFRFFESRHDHEPKAIFGQKGPWTGDDLANLILQQPATSRFVARRLFMYFAHDNPEPEVVERLAKVLRVNNFELAPMLENLFASEEFYSPRTMGAQIKSPCHLVVGAVREFGLASPNYGQLVAAVRDMGQELFEPPSVKGWDGGRTWINATRLFIRYNTITNLLENTPGKDGKTGVDVVGTLLADKTFQSNEEVVDYLARCCLAVPLTQSKRQGMVEFLSGLPPCSEWPARRAEVNAKLVGLLVIMTSSPEYQLT